MEYSNPQIPEGINVTREHPLKEFAQLTLGIVAVVVAVVAALALLAQTLARHIPFETEVELAARYSDKFPARGPVTDYLQALAERLAAAQDLPPGMRITVHYVDEPTVNAFATLGGHVVVFRGLLEKMPHENALAMVLAHEIAHVRHRHPVMSLGRGVVVGLALATVANLSGSDLVGNALGDAGLLTILTFNRDQEAEADRSALAALARHYGHVTGADTFFTVARALPGREAKERLPSFLSTHPLSDERIAALAQQTRANGWASDLPTVPLPPAIRAAATPAP
jgi:predicted Zn-dependent protease